MGRTGELLVCHAREISEPAAERRHRDDSSANFIRYTYDARRRLGEVLPKPIDFEEDLAVAATFQKIRKPDRDAVDEDGIGARRLRLEPREDGARLFDRGPRRVTPGSMLLDAQRHLVVGRHARGEIRHAPIAAEELLGKAALAAARAACNQRGLPGS